MNINQSYNQPNNHFQLSQTHSNFAFPAECNQFSRDLQFSLHGNVNQYSFFHASIPQTVQIKPLENADMTPDNSWIKKWLDHKQKNVMFMKPHMKVRDYVLKIRESEFILSQIENNLKLLEEQIHENECTKLVYEIKQLQMQYNNICSLLTQEKSSVHKKLKQRRKKRASRKRNCIDAVTKMAKKKKKHEEIEKRQAEQRVELFKKKDEEAMKKEADLIFGQIRWKISDTKQLMETVEQLRDLRAIRNTKAQAVGLFTSDDSDDYFNNSMNTLTNLLDKHLETCEIEVKTLSAMSNTVGDTGANPVKKQKWISDKLEADNLVKKDPKALIQIRNEWDACIVPSDSVLGSSIPPFWVLPSSPCNEEWRSMCLTQ